MNSSRSPSATRIAFTTRVNANCPVSQSEYTVPHETPRRRATSRTDRSAGGGASRRATSVYSKDTARTFHLLASGCTGLLGGSASNAVFIDGCTGLHVSVIRKSRPTKPKAARSCIVLHALTQACTRLHSPSGREAPPRLHSLTQISSSPLDSGANRSETSLPDERSVHRPIRPDQAGSGRIRATPTAWLSVCVATTSTPVPASTSTSSLLPAHELLGMRHVPGAWGAAGRKPDPTSGSGRTSRRSRLASTGICGAACTTRRCS
jgi:hypothetical protein